jgi:single-stranded DNA-binding protein
MSDRRITLIGYLGKDREVRQTRERTRIATFHNIVAEMTEEYEVTIRPRDFVVLSLATHEGPKTIWHRLVAWSPERNGLSNMRLARKGDKVEVTGRPETFTYPGADGLPRTIAQIVVERFRILRLKAPHEVP